MRQRVYYYGHAIRWYNYHHNYHRDVDLPAAYDFTGDKLIAVYYYKYRKIHRTTGPAYIHYKLKIKGYYYQNRQHDSLNEMLMMEACR